MAHLLDVSAPKLGDAMMGWLIFLVVIFAGLHFLLAFPAPLAIAAAAIVTIGLWLLWKLKWIILGIIGLEEIFGGRGDGA